MKKEEKSYTYHKKLDLSYVRTKEINLDAVKR